MEDVQDCSMIRLDYHLYMGRLYQVFDFLDNPDKTGNFEFRRPVVSLSRGEESGEKEDGLN